MIKLAREVKHHTARVPGGRKLLQTEDESAIEDPERLFTDAELKSMMTELMSGGYSGEAYQLMLFTQKLHVRRNGASEENEWEGGGMRIIQQ